MIKVAFFGAAGKMGKMLVAHAVADPDFQIVAALDAPNCPAIGKDAGEHAGVGAIGVALTTELPADVQPDVLIDFSSARAFDAVYSLCASRNIPLIYCSTGVSDEQVAKLEELAKTQLVLRSPSMSPAVNLTMKLAQIAGRALKDADADVEIIERHHRYKVDAPSGTALKFGALIAKEMGIDSFRHGREGVVGARPHDEIAYHAIRTGDDPGQHTILFGMLGETLELTVKSSSRDSYATGALQAAKFLVNAAPGKLYDMFDVLDL
ncbi:MAG: 4-hydroxy-tetrahydrodipicolinate reductase [Thermoguttaceae bacterium]|nr:4-hydroxy-tetrahydrodipicolinate reductase [Thermoguttaceae bacterium]